jgi:hypothetical protein
LVDLMNSQSWWGATSALPLAVALLTTGAAAQQRPVPDTAQVDSAHAGMDMGGKHEMPMEMAASPMGVPVDRMGSGTTWTPDAVTLPSLRKKMAGGWDLMTHGLGFV